MTDYIGGAPVEILQDSESGRYVAVIDGRVTRRSWDTKAEALEYADRVIAGGRFNIGEYVI